MLELDYSIENDKPEAPAIGVDGFDELMETTRRTVPHGSVPTECLSRL
jgi:hypothetical protein